MVSLFVIAVVVLVAVAGVGAGFILGRAVGRHEATKIREETH